MTQLVNIINNQVKTTSNIIAETFGKAHKDVIRKIETLEIPQDFGQRNFTPTERIWVNNLGKTVTDKAYEITRDGFTLLAMGFTGKRAMQFKLAYIKAFNEMEKALMDRQLPFIPEPPAVQPVIEFQQSPETMKAVGGMIKKCCKTAVREVFTNDNETAMNALNIIINRIAEERCRGMYQAWREAAIRNIQNTL